MFLIRKRLQKLPKDANKKSISFKIASQSVGIFISIENKNNWLYCDADRGVCMVFIGEDFVLINNHKEFLNYKYYKQKARTKVSITWIP